MTEEQQISDIIRVAREKKAANDYDSNEIQIRNNAVVNQVPGGCWVQAWFWIENVYIEEY